MNREQRREQRREQARLSRRAKPVPKRRSGSGLFAISRSTPYTPEEFARFSNEARMSWHKLCNGYAETVDYDNVVYALNVTRVLAEPLGGDALATVDLAQHRCIPIRERYARLAKFGVDADALRDIPPALDLYDEFLKVCTPLQMTGALSECIRRLEKTPQQTILKP